MEILLSDKRMVTPAGEMKATIHADVLEEEGDALSSGSCLVLRKVCILIVGSRLAR